MAKILDNAAAGQRAIRLQQKHDWLTTEQTALPEVYRHKQEKALYRFTQKANKKLLPAAFLACDKAAYAQCQLEQKLEKYDVKAYLSHRAVNHKAAKAIFRAIHEQQDWTPALQTLKDDQNRLAQKRAQFLQKLEAEKEAFVKKHTKTDPAPYEALKLQLEKEKEALACSLEAKSLQSMEKDQQLLEKRKARLALRIDAARANRTHQLNMNEDVVLSVQGLKMYFGGLKAVDDLSFEVKKGEIFGLIGPNGAGKTTVFNCITQFYKPTGGQLLFRGAQGETIRLTDYPVHDIVLKGIARTFQNLEVVKEVSVLDNLLIAATRQYTSSLFTQMFHLPLLGREERVIRAKADRILKYMDLYAYRDRLCWGLPYGVLKRVEIARALMCNPQLIILDEPAAGLNESETRELAEMIRRIRVDFDCTVLLVEHDMSLVMNVCDHICAISFGRKLAEGTAQQIQASKAVQEAYLGTGGA